MAEATDNLAMEHLRHIRAKVDDLVDDVRSLDRRMGAVERHMAAFHVAFADQNSEVDRLKLRVERIERRLELTD